MDPVYLMHLVLSLFKQYFQSYERFSSTKSCFYTVSEHSWGVSALIPNIISHFVDIQLSQLIFHDQTPKLIKKTFRIGKFGKLGPFFTL